ncbi:MAG: bifunctional adenosylcobinamide kinase/adenosylcobinamide-phosphate guanylyltransferase [Geobacteraceae bacterium]|nr:bifunctional adenosylcobinamide kinase/adenosylcobinamide-phosphate guanylyltransferase [Geobacteraceae bacterium]NTW78533.1 bifunctional adenosylcobinamide kinase/adenosylcobinamide-phosphate guanylyltransferase [Geobacteraceae bacterium]
MAHTIFITGGARSGKSTFAEKVAREFGAPLGYLATAQTLDVEMDERVRRHQDRRGGEWSTIEEPIHLSQALARCDGKYQAILVDCVTLWLTNLLFKYEESGENIEELIHEDLQRLKSTLQGMVTPVILVSNEVGMGIVPDNALARMFRDIAGTTNQTLAAAADEVHVVISGIPLKLK